MTRRICLPFLAIALFAFLCASAASGIHLPCDDVCQSGASGTKNCSYYGEGSCPAYPNPCWMSCSTYWSCTSYPAKGEEDQAANQEEPEFAVGTVVDELEVSHNYGPCLMPFASERGDKSSMDEPVMETPAVEKLDPAAFER
jgi:hypothetical protein